MSQIIDFDGPCSGLCRSGQRRRPDDVAEVWEWNRSNGDRVDPCPMKSVRGGIIFVPAEAIVESLLNVLMEMIIGCNVT